MKKLLLSALSAMAMCGAVQVNAQNSIDILGVPHSVDTIYHAKVGPGTTQTHLTLTKKSTGTTLQVFYLTVDKTTPGVSMRAVCATDKVAGTERPSTMAKRKSGNGVLYFAGTNGDFYSTSGTATNGSSKVGSPTTGCTADRETYKTSNGNYQFSVDTAGVARISRLYYYTGTATLGDKTTLFKGINVSSPNNGITIYTQNQAIEESYVTACGLPEAAKRGDPFSRVRHKDIFNNKWNGSQGCGVYLDWGNLSQLPKGSLTSSSKTIKLKIDLRRFLPLYSFRNWF